MKSIFDLIDNLTVDKTEYELNPSDDFYPYMIQRWISMVSPQMCHLTNELYNIKHEAFTDDQMLYDYIRVVYPRRNKGKINYIQKTVNKNKDKSESLLKEEIARNYQINLKELDEILEFDPSLIENFKDGDAKIYRNES